jgi:ketosteroid isomerase-like protein
MSQSNIETVQNAYAAFGRGDLNGILTTLDLNVVWKTPGAGHVPTGGIRRGHAQVGEFFGALNQVLQFEKFEPQTIVAQGDTVIVIGADILKVKGGTRSVHEPWCHIFKFKNGLIVEFQEILDTATFAAELKSAGALAES